MHGRVSGGWRSRGPIAGCRNTTRSEGCPLFSLRVRPAALEEPAGEPPEDKPSVSGQAGPQVGPVPQKDRWCEGEAPEPQGWDPEMFAAPPRPLRRKERSVPEGGAGRDAFEGEPLRASPDGQLEADVILPPRPRRRNASETPQETLPPKSVDGDDHVPPGGHPASWPGKGRSSPDQTSPRRVPPSTAEPESVASATPTYDPTSVPIIKRIGGPRGPRRSPSGATRSSASNGSSDLAESGWSLHVPAGLQASGAREETPPVTFRTREKTAGGVSLPVPKPRVKKRLSGSFPDAFPPPESGSDGPLGLPVPLPRTKRRLSGAFSDSGPPPEGPGVPLQGERSSPSELEKQVLAAMAEEFPEKVADEASEFWTGEKDLVSRTGTGTGAAQDDWLHVGGSEDKETKEEELDFGFVSVGGPAGSGRVQR